MFVELPPELARSVWCGLLIKSIDGTRDLVANFAAIVMDTLTNMNVKVGQLIPCWCKHASKDIRLFHHGDDFVLLADENDIQWFAEELNDAFDREGPWSARWR